MIAVQCAEITVKKTLTAAPSKSLGLRSWKRGQR